MALAREYGVPALPLRSIISNLQNAPLCLSPSRDLATKRSLWNKSAFSGVFSLLTFWFRLIFSRLISKPTETGYLEGIHR